MTYSIKSVPIDDLSDDEKDNIIDLAEHIRSLKFPRDPELNRNNFLFLTDESSIIIYYIAYLDQKVVAYAKLFYPKENLTSANLFGFAVHPNHYNVALIEGLLHQIANQVVTTKATALQLSSSISEVCEIMEEWGEKAGTQKMNRLYLDDVDWTLMQEWDRVGRERNPDIKMLKIENRIPEQYLEQFVDTYNAMMQTAQYEEVDYGIIYDMDKIRKMEEAYAKQNITWVLRITQEDDGNFSGITELFFLEKRRHQMEQNLTAVLPNYRGKGLGKWLKANLLLEVKERFPDVIYIRTGNQDVNAPMLYINEQMGYQTVSVSTIFRISRNNLERLCEIKK